MSNQKYIGIENELMTFRSFDNRYANFRDIEFLKLLSHISEKKISYYKKTDSAIRTSTGNGFYIDGSSIEILTPPIAINKGFSSRLIDSLDIGRDLVVDCDDFLRHTGFSMHWNLTQSKIYGYDNNIKRDQFYEFMAVPFQLFSLNPLSLGFNLRHKEGRYELLGDSIVSSDQNKASALLYGASLYAFEEYFKRHGEIPFSIFGRQFETKVAEKCFLMDGRYSELDVTDSTGKNKTVQAQEFLETYYKMILPFVKELGHKDEIKNLEDFIFMRKNLEYDKFKEFFDISYANYYENGIFYPSDSKLSILKNNRILKKSGQDLEVPLEGKILGSYVDNNKNKRYFLNDIEWQTIFYTTKDHENAYVYSKGETVEDVFKFAKTFSVDKIPKYVPSLKTKKKCSSFEFEQENKKIEYEFDNESYNLKTGSRLGYIKNHIENTQDVGKVKFFYIDAIFKGLFSVLLSSGIYYGANTIIDSIKIDNYFSKNSKSVNLDTKINGGEGQK